MVTIIQNRDIKVMYVKATSFPDGIQAAFDTLRTKIPVAGKRRIFGISRPEEGKGIVYRAAVEELQDGEAEAYNCERLILPQGDYISIIIHDFPSDMQSIGRAFRELLNEPGLDPQGYCVEVYLNDKDVQCMVRLEK